MKRERDRFLQKARDTRRHHVERSNNCRGMTERELELDYGWNLERIAHDMEHVARNGCRQCGRPFRSMEWGLYELSLDMIDPRRPPHYVTNTMLLCMRCNRAKSNKDPDAWQAELAARRKQLDLGL